MMNKGKFIQLPYVHRWNTPLMKAEGGAGTKNITHFSTGYLHAQAKHQFHEEN
jgi:hypothetical protein